jgi:hypothetical protein
MFAVSAPSPARATELLYLNRCVGGCSLRRGTDDATTDTSSIPTSSNPHLSAFDPAGDGAGDDATWSRVVACLRRVYEPFAIDVTTVDPGSTPHREVMIAGAPTELGLSPGTAAAAPFGCDGISNSIGFAFANYIGNDADVICWSAAQAAAITFGLDHEYLRADVMTTLDGCFPKAFEPIAAPCGDSAPRGCTCGGATQTSYALLGSRAGLGSVIFEDSFEDAWSCHWSQVATP